MSLYRFDLHCPRCGKASEHLSRHGGAHFMPRVSCGDCLMNDVEMVTFTVVGVTKIECAHDWQSDPEIELVDVCSICGEERA
jgi:hypothetical protein